MLKKPLVIILAVFIILKFITFLTIKEPILDEYAYYFPAAQSYLKGEDDPNFQHPPLGKEILAMGLYVFGKNTVGLRSTPLAAWLIISILTYFLALNLSKSAKVAFMAILILSFETLWFLYSTLAYLEIFLVLFSILTIYFQWLYLQKSKPPFLLISCIFLGAAIAVKWSGLFLTAPTLISVLFLSKNRILQKTTGIAAIFLIPPLIYLIVYLPYIYRNSVTDFLRLPKKIYEYQQSLSPEKVYIQRAPLDFIFYRPIGWFVEAGAFFGFQNGKVEGAPAAILYEDQDTVARLIYLVNPFVLWGGTFIFFTFSVREFFKKNKAVIFISAFTFFSIAPYFFVGRIVYMYYLLSSIPLLSVLIAIYLNKFVGKKDQDWKVLWFIGCEFLFFLIFLPLLLGIKMPIWYLSRFIGYP